MNGGVAIIKHLHTAGLYKFCGLLAHGGAAATGEMEGGKRGGVTPPPLPPPPLIAHVQIIFLCTRTFLYILYSFLVISNKFCALATVQG
jgi:hypothetical protein